MLDRIVLRALQPGLQRVAVRLAGVGVGADAVTLFGFAFGMAGASAIALKAPLVGLALLLIGRLADGLDGVLARVTQPTDRGAFLDITLDFLFYAAVPLAFAVADREANALAAAVLLAAFVGTGSTFLAFALLAERRGLQRSDYLPKGLYYLGGLTEGTETLVCFVCMCLWPSSFALFAYVFAVLCLLTIATRLWDGWRLLSPD